VQVCVRVCEESTVLYAKGGQLLLIRSPELFLLLPILVRLVCIKSSLASEKVSESTCVCGGVCGGVGGCVCSVCVRVPLCVCVCVRVCGEHIRYFS